MDLQRLDHELFCAFGDTLPADAAVQRGGELRRKYEACVKRYRAIVRLALAGRGQHGGDMTHPINLGERNIPLLGRVMASAVVRMTEYSPATDRRQATPFATAVDFHGEREGRVRHLHTEVFGAAGCNLFGMRMPGFIRIPGATYEQPWSQSEAIAFDNAGREFPWSIKNYPEVYERLAGIVSTAEDTQVLLIGALQDPQLNPRFAQGAAELALPEGRPVAA